MGMKANATRKSEQKAASLEAENAELTEAIRALQEDKGDRVKEVTLLEEQIRTLKKEMKTLQEENASLKNEKDKKEEEKGRTEKKENKEEKGDTKDDKETAKEKGETEEDVHIQKESRARETANVANKVKSLSAGGASGHSNRAKVKPQLFNLADHDSDDDETDFFPEEKEKEEEKRDTEEEKGEAVAQFCDMGFESAQVDRCLELAQGNPLLFEYLMSEPPEVEEKKEEVKTEREKGEGGGGDRAGKAKIWRAAETPEELVVTADISTIEFRAPCDREETVLL